MLTKSLSFGLMKRPLALGSLVILFLSLGQTMADDAEPASVALELELNSVRQVETACRLVFLAINRLGGDLQSVAFETVLIDQNGIVARLTVFDFQDLPEARARVRQFDLGDTDCETLGQILINGTVSCEGESVEPDACIDALGVSSRTDVELTG